MKQEELIEKTHEAVNDIRHNMAKMLVHQEQHRKELDKHEESISKLNAHKDKLLGIVSLMGAVMGALAGWIARKI